MSIMENASIIFPPKKFTFGEWLIPAGLLTMLHGEWIFGVGAEEQFDQLGVYPVLVPNTETGGRGALWWVLPDNKNLMGAISDNRKSGVTCIAPSQRTMPYCRSPGRCKPTFRMPDLNSNAALRRDMS